jgi:hypothetical protein
MIKLRIQLAPVGLLVGSPSLVKELAGKPLPPPLSFTGGLNTTGQIAFGPKTVMGMRFNLADPYGGLISAGQMPGGIKLGPEGLKPLDLARMVLAQFKDVTMGVTRADASGLEYVMHATTLYRRGATGEDKARALYLAGTKARLAGDTAALALAREALRKDHPDTLYAQRLGATLENSTGITRLMLRHFLPEYVQLMKKVYKPWFEVWGIDKKPAGPPTGDLTESSLYISHTDPARAQISAGTGG